MCFELHFPKVFKPMFKGNTSELIAVMKNLKAELKYNF